MLAGPWGPTAPGTAESQDGAAVSAAIPAPSPALCKVKWVTFYVVPLATKPDPPSHLTVLGIRIRMFLGLPDPGPLVRGMDPDPALFSKVVERV